MTDSRPEKETGSAAAEQTPAVSPPSGYDPDWRERIEIARQARDQARKARGDRPVTFEKNRLPI